MQISMDAQTPLVTFEDVTFSYGPTTAVEHVSFTVEPGDFVALIGPNGSGKTTLLKLALGLERPQHGRVLLFGQEIDQFKEWHRIGYVPQQASAFKVRFPATVGEVVSYGEYRGFDPLAIFRTGISPAVEGALHTVDMWEYRQRLVSELSTGQQQRLLIARALVHQPALLMLDEPTAGVDVAGQDQFYTLLRQLCRDQGTTVLLVSHDVGVVLHEATKVVCINRTLVFHGSAQEVTDADLSRLYGFSVDLIIHRHQ
ncbi:MAG: metal ABC transporter ATP-binding protein [Dehalococcoidia bacterium]|nr:metal ABC transporter ATP-binding protein [Dehalococcoidia bacterium]